MALVQNTFIPGTTEYYELHIPYTTPNGIAIDKLSDMYSYNIEPRATPLVINQPIGSRNSFGYVFSIKNLTQNVQLQIDIVSKENFITASNPSFIIAPGKTVEVNIILDKSRVNSLGSPRLIEENLTVTIKNLSSQLAIRQPSATPLEVVSVPDETTIE
jgi:hypothetical protein